MSRAELDNIQSQLRMAIKSHQGLVARMKDDPQNTMLQNQLHGLQTSITTLSERQKLIVQQLRKELIPIQPRVAASQPGQVHIAATPLQLGTTQVQVATTQVQLGTSQVQPAGAPLQLGTSPLQLATTQLQAGNQAAPQLQLATTQLQAAGTPIQLSSQVQSIAQLQPTLTLQSVTSQLQPGTAQLHTVSVSQLQQVTQLQLQPVQLQSGQAGLQLTPQGQLQVTPGQVQLVGTQLPGGGFQLAPVTQVMLTPQTAVPAPQPQPQVLSPGVNAANTSGTGTTTPTQQQSPAKPPPTTTSITAAPTITIKPGSAPRVIAPRVNIPAILKPPTPGSVAIVRPGKGNVSEGQKSVILNRPKPVTSASAVPRSGSPLIRVPSYQSKPAGSHHKPTILNKPSGSQVIPGVPVVNRQSAHERKTAPERVKVIPKKKKVPTATLR